MKLINNFSNHIILGRGTFGIARLCRYVPLNEYLCVKVLNKETVVKLKQVEHVLSEKYILSNCRHPFIVQLFVFSLISIFFDYNDDNEL